MAKFSEESLNGWTKPPSDTEETKLSNSERMVKEAIDKNEKLKIKRKLLKFLDKVPMLTIQM